MLRDITKRFVEKVEKEKPVLKHLADALGVKYDNLFKWAHGQNNPSPEDEKKIKDWIDGKIEVKNRLTKGTDFTKKRNDLKLSHERNKRIPFIEAPASAGLAETEMSPIHAPAGTIDIGDLLHDSEAAIRIYGNSMIPNYPPGCVIGLAKCYDAVIEPGEVYVIERRNSRILKRLFYKDDDPDSEYLTCYSDNIILFSGGPRNGKPAYPPFNIHKSDIINLFMVTGVIKRNSNSIILHRNSNIVENENNSIE